MSRKPIKVLLSGTRKDLRPYWAVAAGAVRAVDGFEPAMMEGGSAAPIPPDQWSRREATIPDLYVGLVGRCYGQVPQGQERSLTEQEYDTSGHVGIDRLLFLTEDSDPGEVSNEDGAAHEAVERFRVKVKGDVVFDKVPTPAEFKSRLTQALRDWERRTLRGATTTVEDFFRAWVEGTPDFGHQDELIARQREVAALEEFVRSSQRILVLEASWGQGKSRLLLELARKLGKRVRFIREEAELTRGALDISAVDPCVIVLEDVQRRNADDRRRLLDLIRRFGSDVKLILSSRPSQVEGILGDIRQLGFNAADFAHIGLEPLADREHRQLVATILGADSEEAHIIARRTRGNILAGVVTARMFKRGAVTLGQIESSEEFRHAVLRSFETALLDHARQGVDQRFREMLELVSLAGPLNTDDEEAIVAVAEFLSWRPHVVRSTVADLLDADLLIRHGGRVRVPVDALAEDVRRRACMTKAGESVGYAEDAPSRLWPAVGSGILRNLASLAWDLKQEGVAVDFFRSFWPRVTTAYDSAPASRRLRLLEDLEALAAYAPATTVGFVRHALPTGLGPEEDSELLRGRLQLHLVHDRLAKLLEGVLYHAEHVSEACDLLWTMAEQDGRDPQHHTSSAERILRDAAKYRPRMALAPYQAILRWATRRYREAPRIDGKRLAQYVRPLLDREMEHTWSDGEAIHMSARGLTAEALGALRRDTLDFLEAIAGEDDLSSVVAALDGIGHTLSTPPGAFGRVLSPQEIAQWNPEELASLERIERIRQRHTSRVVDLCILSEIEWVAEHSEHVALRERAAAMLSGIREALAGSLELAFSHAYQLYRLGDGPRSAQHDQDVETIAAAHSTLDALTLVARVRDVTATMEAAARRPDPTAFLMHVARLNPDLGEELVTQALDDPEDALIPSLSGLLGGIAEADPTRATTAAERIMESPEVRAVRVLAGTYKFPRFIERLGTEKAIHHLDHLLQHPDRWVREGALSAIGFRNELPQGERVRLLMGYDVAASPESGEEWAEAFRGGKLITDCSPDELRVVSQKLVDSSKLEYWSCNLVAFLAQRVPDATVDALVARIPRANDDGYDATLDRTQSDPLAELSAVARERGMIALGAYLGNPLFRIASAASELFGKLATGDPDLMRRVRLAWITSGDAAQIAQAAQSLSYEESEFLLDEELIVIALLGAAEGKGPEVLRDIESDLHAVASRGIRTGTPGEAFSRDVALRDRSKEIAARHPEGSLGRKFYSAVARHTQSTIEFLQRRHDELSE